MKKHLGQLIFLCILFSLSIVSHALPGDVAPRGAPDGQFDVSDIIVLQQIVLGKITPTSEEFIAADVAPKGSPDGIIDIADVVVLQNAVLTQEFLPSAFILCLPGNGCSADAYLVGAAYYKEIINADGSVSIHYYDADKNLLTLEYDVYGKIVGSNLVHSYEVPSDSTGGASVDVVGSLKGDFIVTPSGSASYSIPIEIPPGVAGIQPDLSLVYDNQAGNGLLGMGWALEGLSEITRCPSTKAQDMDIRGVYFDIHDKYCIDGMRLIAVSGEYGADGTEYTTEIDSGLKIFSYGSTSNNTGPEKFLALNKDGAISEYGYTEDSRVEAQNKTAALKWAVNSVYDQYNNVYYVQYHEDNVNGIHVPLAIYYTDDGIPANAVEYAAITFEYEARPDWFINHIFGSAIGTHWRIDRVKTWHMTGGGSSVVKDYQLTYETSDVTGNSRIKTIKECSVNESVCKRATELNWQNSSLGVTSETWGVSSSWGEARYTFVGDFTGDGKTDIASAYGSHTYMKISTGSSFDSQNWVQNGTWGNRDYTWSADFNGDGRADIASAHGSNIYMKISTGSGFRDEVWSISNPWGSPAFVFVDDFNGDGRADIASGHGNSVYMNISTGTGFSSTNWSVNQSWGSSAFTWAADFNGDGLTDIASANGSLVYMRLSTGAGFTASTWAVASTWGSSAYTRIGDFNGDGLADIASMDSGSVHMKLSSGNGFKSGAWSVPNAWGSADYTWVGDFNGDGKSDIVSAYYGNLHVHITGQNAFINDIWDVDNLWGSGGHSRVVDLNGDGISDFYSANGSSIYVNLSSGIFPDLVTSVTNGFGVSTSIVYKNQTDNTVYTRGASGGYPNIDVQNARALVASKTTTDGLNGTVTTTYKYGGDRLNLEGRGQLGFAWTESNNTKTGLVTSVDYYQFHNPEDYPFIGMVTSETQILNGEIIKTTNNTVAQRLSSSNRPVPYVSRKVEQNYDALNRYINTLTSTSTVNEYGDVVTMEIETTDGIDTYTTVTTNTYGKKSSINWHEKGLVTQSQTSKMGSDGTAPVVTNTYNYLTTGKLDNESSTVNGITGLNKAYTYNTFGQVDSTTISGVGIVNRLVEIQYDESNRFPQTVTNEMGHTITRTYNGRFGVPLTKTDANGLTTTYDYNDFGEVTDTYLPGGNRIHVAKSWCTQNCTLPAITSSVLSQVTKFTVTTQEFGGSGSNENYKPDVKIYYDKLGREIRKRTTSHDGKVIYVDTAYDDLGRVVATTQPYFANTANKNPTITQYDSLNRVISISIPGEGTTTIAYNDPAFTVTTSKNVFNPIGIGITHTSTKIKNVIGQTLEVIDSAGNHLYYEYDAQGNKVSTSMPSLTDSGSVLNAKGTVITMGYDDFGRKTSMVDPNMGGWSYDYDISGNLISQTDAKGQTTIMEYDALGRMNKRTDHDGTITHWIYNDNLRGSDSPNTMAIGKLDSVRMVNALGDELYRQNFTFTADLGLMADNEILVDGSAYVTTTGYDRFHRPETVIYPNTSNDIETERHLEIKYQYDNGTLNTIQKADGTVTYWQASHRDANGAVRMATLGNGVQQWRDYDVAGRLTWMNFGYSGNVYNVNYQYDTLGNLVYRDTTRSGSSQTLEENYTYDNLNRLTNVNINHMVDQSFTYDVLGNIRSKTGVNNYEYDASRPHAISKINSLDYVYDANGSILQAGDRSVTWTSFNKPERINDTEVASNFFYGPSRGRYKQTTEDLSDSTKNTTTMYIGGFYEKVIANDTTTHKHYIKVGGETIAQYSITSSNIEKTEYFHRDNQGSLISVTGVDGRVTSQLDYDAFGNRRVVLGESVIDGVINNVSRGYTGHEHLDKLALIHMNGRVFDPLLGRFLSADPYVQYADNLQSYNRYSYVLNNPMSYTDPSGFLSKKVKKALSAAAFIANPTATAGTYTVVKVAYSKPVQRAFLKHKGLRAVGSIASAVHPASAALFAAYLTDISGGSLGDVAKSAAIAGGAAWAFGEINNAFRIPNNPYGTQLPIAYRAMKILSHGAVGGMAAEASGGKFKNGFWTTAKWLTVNMLFDKSVKWAMSNPDKQSPWPCGKHETGVDGKENFLWGSKGTVMKWVDSLPFGNETTVFEERYVMAPMYRTSSFLGLGGKGTWGGEILANGVGKTLWGGIYAAQVYASPSVQQALINETRDNNRLRQQMIRN